MSHTFVGPWGSGPPERDAPADLRVARGRPIDATGEDRAVVGGRGRAAGPPLRTPPADPGDPHRLTRVLGTLRPMWAASTCRERGGQKRVAPGDAGFSPGQGAGPAPRPAPTAYNAGAVPDGPSTPGGKRGDQTSDRRFAASAR
jgi:hypothetical protein